MIQFFSLTVTFYVLNVIFLGHIFFLIQFTFNVIALRTYLGNTFFCNENSLNTD